MNGNCHGAIGGRERVTIWYRFRRQVESDGSRRAGPVVDEHRLTERGTQPLSISTRHGIGRAAGRERRDQPYRLGGPLLRSRVVDCTISAVSYTHLRAHET